MSNPPSGDSASIPVLKSMLPGHPPYRTGAPGLANSEMTRLPKTSALLITSVPVSVTGPVSPAKGIDNGTTGMPASANSMTASINPLSYPRGAIGH